MHGALKYSRFEISPLAVPAIFLRRVETLEFDVRNEYVLSIYVLTDAFDGVSYSMSS